MKTILSAAVLLVAHALVAAAAEPVSFTSPGFPPTAMDPQGRLVEDWGTVAVKLSGEGVVDGPVQVEAIKLDDLVPAVRARSARGAVNLVSTAYRAPIFPAGVDVLTVRVEEPNGRPAHVTVTVDMPQGARAGLRTVKLANRTILTQPGELDPSREIHEWGSCDEATTLRGWARPEGECDPAFRNIRAGMGGVPIVYRFSVPPKSEADVVLGLCESHWAVPAQRPLVCRVEGAKPQPIDPVAKWGQHKPGGLLAKARDENGDGKLQIEILPARNAKDRNTILNAIWIFPAGKAPGLGKVIAGKANADATRYVDVGGDTDQSIYPADKLEYRLSLPANGTRELTFFAACNGGSAPLPDVYPWTPEATRQAACDVWRDWRRE
jgi:hypothetical protein